MNDSIGSTNDFDAFASKHFNRAPILVGSRAHCGVVKPDTLDQKKIVIAGKSSNIRRGLPEGGLLNYHGRKSIQDFGHGASFSAYFFNLHSIG